MMTTKVATSQTPSSKLAEKPVTQPRVVPLTEIMETVREDARREPARFLDEVVVPKGGE